MRLIESYGLILARVGTSRRKFLELWKPIWLRIVLTMMGLLAFTRLLAHALVRIAAIAFLIVWGEICDAQPYELFGETHAIEYWYYARLLYLGAIILGIDTFICIGQAMNSLWFWMELRELTPRLKKTKKRKLLTK